MTDWRRKYALELTLYATKISPPYLLSYSADIISKKESAAEISYIGYAHKEAFSL